jgi:hypothetical protein
VDIRDANIHMDIVRGFLEPFQVRGEDTIIPGAAGRTERARVEDSLIIELRGYIHGTGATLVARQQSWRAKTDIFLALLDLTLASGNLVVTTPYLGLPSGTKTISCKCVNFIGGPIIASEFQTWSVELEAIGSDWA